MHNDVFASVVRDPELGLFWHSAPATSDTARAYVVALPGLSKFVTRYGSAPTSVALHVKLRRDQTAGLLNPTGYLSLFRGTAESELITLTDVPSFSPSTEDWTIGTYQFSASEINLLKLSDGDILFLEFLAFEGSPDPVDIAWFALTYGLPQ